MKKLLLDTHVFLWWLSNAPHLPQVVVQEIANPENKVYVSAVTSWEISIKKALGKLKAPTRIESIVEEKGFDPLPITIGHGEQVAQLPDFPQHKDPFDRMLIAQAQVEGLMIVTHDQQFRHYAVNLLWND